MIRRVINLWLICSGITVTVAGIAWGTSSNWLVTGGPAEVVVAVAAVFYGPIAAIRGSINYLQGTA